MNDPAGDHTPRLIIMDSSCPTYAVALTRRRRLLDRLRYGHARHRCTQDEPLHPDDHRCACGVRFPSLWPLVDQSRTP